MDIAWDGRFMARSTFAATTASLKIRIIISFIYSVNRLTDRNQVHITVMSKKFSITSDLVKYISRTDYLLQGDSGGPLNCPDGGTRVAGVTSWGVSSGTGNCLQTYPSVYTRTSAYLGWIAANTP